MSDPIGNLLHEFEAASIAYHRHSIAENLGGAAYPEQRKRGREERDEAYIKLTEAIAGLSVAPAPVAAIPNQLRDLLLQKALTYKSDGEYRIAEALEDVAEEVYRAPPVQEGPKVVEAEAKLEELLFDFAIEAHRIHPHVFFNGTKVGPKANALRSHYLQSRTPAQSIPAAIDEEGREAISAAILSLEEQKIVLGMYRSIPETVNSATNGRAAIERHIAALERLLADPDPSRTQG